MSPRGSSKVQQLRYRRSGLIRAAGLSLAILVLIGVFAASVALPWIAPVSVDLTSLAPPVGGPTCDVTYYDSHGVGHVGTIDSLDYTGPGPLYFIEPELTPVSGSRFLYDCPVYAPSVPPTLTLRGLPVYPWSLTVAMPSVTLKQGESRALSAQLAVDRVFTEENVGNVVPGEQPGEWILYTIDSYTPTQETRIALQLEGAGMEIAPPPDRVIPVPVAFERPARQQWVIAPKEKSVGDQGLMVVAVEGDQRRTMALISVKVESALPLSTTQLAMIGAIAGAIAWLLLQWKTLLEIRNLQHQLNAAKG